MVAFPSLVWFQALARLMNERQEAFKRLGYADVIRNIQQYNGPDRDHTLNRLALMDDPLYIAAKDFLERDLFARYGQTFQLFFNGTVQVPTEFAL